MTYPKDELFARHFDHAETVERGIYTNVVFDGEGSFITVQPVWKGVDRTRVGGYGFRDNAKGRAFAKRLMAAMSDPKNYLKVECRVDIYGFTYIEAPLDVWGKRLDADLKRLGY